MTTSKERSQHIENTINEIRKGSATQTRIKAICKKNGVSAQFLCKIMWWGSEKKKDKVYA
ncbi:MAG: hypothetical protein COA36_16660 [Desulfotalea sp.]|nr:MAG: hypothetical protein COA36_16660 [Desulfotalea sp.]